MDSPLPPLRARHALLVAGSLFLILCAAQLALLLALTGGHFSYTLDDPYIHLEVARAITRGEYGINPGEPAAPASSALWPLLLVPFAALGAEHLAPLALNLLSTLGALVVADELLRLALAGWHSLRREALLVLLLVLLGIATNLAGLAFMGMEHSLQVAVALITLRGMVAVVAEGRLPWWLVPAIVAGPLLRYESLALSVPALLLLASRRRYGAALAGATGIALGLGAFALFLSGMGLGPLPTSVRAKGAGAGGLITTLRTREALIFLICGALLLGRALVAPARHPARPIALALALAAGLYLGVGSFSSYWRYEVFLLATMLVGLVYLYGAPLGRLLGARTPTQVAAILGLACLPLASVYLQPTLTTPFAAASIYRQQHQLHRLAVDYYGGSVAVNDIGWVAYRNEHYVLDLLGLASEEALELRLASEGGEWMDYLTEARGVDLVMISDVWFPERPAAWQTLGVLRLGTPIGAVPSAEVTIYATHPEAVVPISAALARFAPTLPHGVTLELTSMARASVTTP